MVTLIIAIVIIIIMIKIGNPEHPNTYATRPRGDRGRGAERRVRAHLNILDFSGMQLKFGFEKLNVDL